MNTMQRTSLSVPKTTLPIARLKGKSVGLPPFGTVRDDEGFLVPSTEGAWLLPSGQFAEGSAEVKPEENALWRGYYKAAFRVLELYVKGDKDYINLLTR